MRAFSIFVCVFCVILAVTTFSLSLPLSQDTNNESTPLPRLDLNISSIDCGYVRVRSAYYNRRNRTSSSPFKLPSFSLSRGMGGNRNFFAVPVRRVYNCWRAANVTESLQTGTFNGSEAIFEFPADTCSLENMTQAILRIMLASADGEIEKNQTVLRGIQLSALVKDSTGAILKEEDINASNLRPDSVPNRLTFDVMELLTLADLEENMANNKVCDNSRITVRITARRIDNQLNSDIHSKILNTAFHRPSLKVFYM